jgi:hypothetical protein
MKPHHLKHLSLQLLRHLNQRSKLLPDHYQLIRYLFRRALEIALLLKEHPDCTCVLVTLIQEYQSRFVLFNQIYNVSILILFRFQKPLHVSELYTMKHVIDIQDYGGNRVARLLPTFRIRFDENNIQVNYKIFLFKIRYYVIFLDSFGTTLLYNPLSKKFYC